MERPLNTKQHAMLDYVTGAAMPMLTKFFDAKTPARRLIGLVTGVTAGQTMLTDFEGGKVGLLPMQAHLTSDVVLGVSLLGAAALMKNESPKVRMMLAGIGAFSLVAAALTDPIPQGKGESHAKKTAQRVRKVAGRTMGELAGA